MLTTGMLWFDDSAQRSLGAKVQLAAQHYQEKYGHAPNVCYVPPDAAGIADAQLSAIRIVPLVGILRHHLWLGVVNGEPDKPTPRC